MPAQPTDATHSALPWHRRIGKRVAALGVVGALMVALPLIQVLRFHAADAEALSATRARLDPVARAFELQRGLIAHRDSAALVLGGQTRAEPERRLRQGEVDQRVAGLDAALADGLWPRAQDETAALRDDWVRLAPQIAARALSAAESDQAHRLLVEQTLQVVDLVGDLGLPYAAASAVVALRPMLAAAQALPRLTWQLSQLAPAADSAVHPRELAAAEARLARTVGLLNAALATQGSEAMPALAEAAAGAGAAADRWFHLLRTSAAPSELAQALQATQAAQHTLFAAAQASAAAQIGGQEQRSRRHLQLLIAALAVLALAALALAASLLGGTSPPMAPSGAGADDLAGSAPPQQQAGQLIDRLRGPQRARAPEAPTTMGDTP